MTDTKKRSGATQAPGALRRKRIRRLVEAAPVVEASALKLAWDDILAGSYTGGGNELDRGVGHVGTGH